MARRDGRLLDVTERVVHCGSDAQLLLRSPGGSRIVRGTDKGRILRRDAGDVLRADDDDHEYDDQQHDDELRYIAVRLGVHVHRGAIKLRVDFDVPVPRWGKRTAL